MALRSKLPGKFYQILAFIFFFYICFKNKTQVMDYKVFIPNQHPKRIWEFLADFSNVVKLNPRIENWKLEGETISNVENGKPEWKYKVISYEDMIGSFLFGLNENHGEIVVKESGDHFSIHETYVTHSFHKLITVDNWTRMNFREVEVGGVRGTLFEEKVFVTCPLILSFVCKLETDKNRDDFLQNLRRIFD